MTSHELEKQRVVSQMADFLCDHGLSSTALIGLEAGRPLALLGGQLLWLFQPLMGMLMPRERITEVAVVLEDPEAVEQLICTLTDRNEAEVGRS